MRIKFLGTGAAEGVPAVFCNCDMCKSAKQKGGKNIRTRSQILIDDDTLFDFPMDTYMHMLTYKLDLSAIKRVLITHSHMDHCYPQEFCMRGAPFASSLTEQNVDIYCNADVARIFALDTAREMRKEIENSINVNIVHAFERIKCADMTIIPLPAAHTAGEECLVYHIARGGKGALFMNDTGIIKRDVYSRLFDMGARIDFAAFDCTYGARRQGEGRHMGLYDIVDQLDIIKKVGLLNAGAKLYATHFSHNCTLDHEGLCVEAQGYGINVAYDGAEVEV